ncbi:hypothetical protein CDLVIII_2124 [Clostridium sp. DL-VIII]|uniref:teicoplanin resistance protein VanZ n=1 Tax=Clostridium sp. DL-VIII TaxID=641107 RepID=UPI00023AFA67|nr:teicoplanin resistance protein VanZ [Clostridium sp. DL-VIII]EHI98787.1 hypothetical protein CDLVIII_2124 [Clostridium sp. DL-VIII]
MDFEEIVEKQNIIPCKIEEKSKMYQDLWNIKNNWTGRVDANIANTFIEESVQLIENAISIFEMGYFDCAYYSLRQALEISTTMVFLVDIEDDKRIEKLDDWKKERHFPMDGKMKKYLTTHGRTFSDMKIKMKKYFDEIDRQRKSLNKYVHKQGYQYFYVSRINSIHKDKLIESLKNSFISNVKFCIGVVAVMRLAVDPFPILLMDEEIYYRTNDTITYGYTEDFVKEYISIDTIKQYKTTEIYQEFYEQILRREPKSEAVADVVKNQYIDITKVNEIMLQSNLMGVVDFIAVSIVSIIPSISKVYCYGGMLWYFTDIKTNRKKMNWSTSDFKRFSESTKKFNLAYDEVYISCVKINDETYFIEHNDLISNEEKEKIQKLEFILNSVVQEMEKSYET